MLLDGLTGEPDVHHCVHTATFLPTSLDTPSAVRLTGCGGTSRCVYRPGVTRQMPVGKQTGIAPARDQADISTISEGRAACELTHRHGPYADRLSASPFLHDVLYPHRHEWAVATSRPPPVFSPVVVAALPGSVRLHLDPAWACFVSTRNRQFQHAVLQVCIDLRCVEVRAQ